MKRKKIVRVLLIIIISILGLLLIINLFFLLAPQFGSKPDKERMEYLAREAVYAQGKFHNARPVPVMLPKSYVKLARLALKSKKGRTPGKLLPGVQPDFSPIGKDSPARIVWLGHSTVYMQICGVNILTDPAFSKRASPIGFFGPHSFPGEHATKPAQMPVPDIIVLSHDHFDHLDHKTVKDHYTEVRLFAVPLGMRDHLERWGVDSARITEFDWWQEEKVFGGLSLIATPAQHFSGRRKQDNSTLWCSWIIKGKNEQIYFSGDSGFADHFGEIGERYGPFDLALVECGAYGQYWPHIHMLPEETVQAALDIKAERVLPIHWGKYNLAFHSWKEPIERFTREAGKRGLDFTTPKTGQWVYVSGPFPQQNWWEE